ATGAHASGHALVLPASTSLRFLPNGDFFGTPGDLTVRVADVSGGAVALNTDANITAAIGGTGIWSTSTMAIRTSVTNVNDAPTIGAGGSYTGTEDVTDPAGVPAGSLVPNSADATDGAAATAVAGIAITANAATAQQGTWEYKIGAGAWTAVPTGTPGDGSALVLAASDHLRFTPAANFNGTAGGLTVRVSDETGLAAGTTVNLAGAGIGGTGHWSNATAGIGIGVTAVNDAPLANGTATLTAIAEDNTTSGGDTLSSLLVSAPNAGYHYDDRADTVAAALAASGSTATALAGVAIVANAADATSQGTWQYNSGAGWVNIPATAALGNTHAIVLAPTALLRFVPVTDYNGTPGTLSVRLSDGVGFVAGADTNIAANVGTPGGWSDGTTAIRIAVGAGNDPPDSADKAFNLRWNERLDLKPVDFAFTDVDAGDVLVKLRIDSLTSQGTLLFNGAPVRVNDEIVAADLGKLAYVPQGAASLLTIATFSVSDGTNWDVAPNKLVVNVAPKPAEPAPPPPAEKPPEEKPPVVEKKEPERQTDTGEKIIDKTPPTGKDVVDKQPETAKDKVDPPKNSGPTNAGTPGGPGNGGESNTVLGPSLTGSSIHAGDPAQSFRSETLNPVSLSVALQDRVLPGTGVQNFAIPQSAFQHVDPSMPIHKEATQPNGAPLPAYVQFNNRTGQFQVDTVAAKASGAKVVDIKVTGRDVQGNEASAVFRVLINRDDTADRRSDNGDHDGQPYRQHAGVEPDGGEPQAADGPLGHAGLSQQLQQVGQAGFDRDRQSLIDDILALVA
ncbi:MAG: hypothetical protein HY985_02065, partial [Magnetospirillum sp.]|nr:hypothetical protein [Magnetospirillum sp.]